MWRGGCRLNYVTDNFKLSIGHFYGFARSGLTLGAEQGFALGGGRMASVFARAVVAEGGDNAALVGLRIYFGQHDKTLMARNRQDDPDPDVCGNVGGRQISAGGCSDPYSVLNGLQFSK
jgi:hypothetical protein